MSFRSSSSMEQQKPSRQVKQKRRSTTSSYAYADYDAYDAQPAYKRKEKYQSWKHLVEDEGDYDVEE